MSALNCSMNLWPSSGAEVEAAAAASDTAVLTLAGSSAKRRRFNSGSTATERTDQR